MRAGVRMTQTTRRAAPTATEPTTLGGGGVSGNYWMDVTLLGSGWQTRQGTR